jgi:hypothetical protein
MRCPRIPSDDTETRTIIIADDTNICKRASMWFSSMRFLRGMLYVALCRWWKIFFYNKRKRNVTIPHICFSCAHRRNLANNIRVGRWGKSWAWVLGNLIYERVRLVRLERLVWFLFLEIKYWRGICPPCASQVRLMLAQMPKKIINLFISITMTLLIVLWLLFYL